MLAVIFSEPLAFIYFAPLAMSWCRMWHRGIGLPHGMIALTVAYGAPR